MRIQQFMLDALTWTPIRVPDPVPDVNDLGGCNGFTLKDSVGTTAIKIRSDPSDMTTEMTIPVGLQGVVNVPISPSSRVRFPTKEIVTYAQSAGGTITAVASFL